MAETDTDRANAGRAKQLETLDKLALKFGQSLTKALTGNVGAGRPLDGVLGSLSTKLSNVAVKAALAPVKVGITSLVKGLLNSGASSEAFARGGVVAGGRVRPFASGGIVAAPTYFPMRDGLGLMGEAGAAATGSSSASPTTTAISPSPASPTRRARGWRRRRPPPNSASRSAAARSPAR